MLPQGSTTPSCAQEPCARFKEMTVRFIGIVSSSASPGELLYRLSMPGPRFLPCGCGGLSRSLPARPMAVLGGEWRPPACFGAAFRLRLRSRRRGCTQPGIKCPSPTPKAMAIRTLTTRGSFSFFIRIQRSGLFGKCMQYGNFFVPLAEY